MIPRRKCESEMEEKKSNEDCANEQVTVRGDKGSIPLGSLERDCPIEGRGAGVLTLSLTG